MSLEVVEQSWTLAACEYTATFASRYLLVFAFSHYIIAVLLFFLGLVYKRELFLFIFSWGITANFYLNWLLQWAAMQPVPTATCGYGVAYCVARDSPYNACGEAPFPVPPPSGATCGALPLPPCDPCVPCGMPAFEPQMTAFTATSIGIFAMQWRAPHIQLYHMVLIVIVYALVIYTHLFFGFNDVPQVLAGVAVGAAFAALWNLFTFFVLYPYFDVILAWRLTRAVDYHDTICRAYEPVPGDPEPMANALVGDDDDDAAAQRLAFAPTSTATTKKIL